MYIFFYSFVVIFDVVTVSQSQQDTFSVDTITAKKICTQIL